MFGLTPRWLVGAALSALLLVSPAIAQGTGSSSGAAKQGSKPAASAPKQAADDSTGGLVEVTVTGKGATTKEAFDDAIRTALRQVAGTFVRTDSKVQDDQLVQDRIITHSQGFIEKATKKGAAKLKDGAYEQEAIVIVRVGKVEEVFTESAVSSTEIDGDSLAAKVRSLRENKASADELLAAVFEGFPANVMDCEIAPECTGDRLKPSTPPENGGFDAESLRLEDDQVFVLLKVDVWVNERKWKAWAKAAEDALKAVAIGGHTIKINAKKTGARKLTMNMGRDDWIRMSRPWMSEACGKAEHLAWARGSLDWSNLIWSEFNLDIASRRAVKGDTLKDGEVSLKDGEVSLKDAGVIAIIPSMGATSFSSFALPRSALWGALRTDQLIELELNLFNGDGDSLGTLVPMLGTGCPGGRITTALYGKYTNHFTGCPWWVDTIYDGVRGPPTDPTEGRGALLLPMFPMSKKGYVILCSRLTIPVGVILTEQELASLTKVEARLGDLIPDQR